MILAFVLAARPFIPTHVGRELSTVQPHAHEVTLPSHLLTPITDNDDVIFFPLFLTETVGYKPPVGYFFPLLLCCFKNSSII